MLPGKEALPVNSTLQNGKYSIKSILGQGGFGITYCARHQVLQVDVAIKEMFLSAGNTYCTRKEDSFWVNPHFEEERFNEFKQRFLNEAYTLARFKGIAGIVQVIDTFEENGTVYFVMEYIKGKTLKLFSMESGGMLSEPVAVPIILDILESLKIVHSKGILHRDINPNNILLTDEKKPVLIDFGIAREYEEDVTMTQTTFRTMGFSAPEQAVGKAKRGAYTDLYSVGATLYFLLTKERPQTSDEIELDGFKSPRDINPAVSGSLDAVIVKALSKKPAERYQSCEEMITALRGTVAVPQQTVQNVNRDDVTLVDDQPNRFRKDTPANVVQTEKIGQSKPKEEKNGGVKENTINTIKKAETPELPVKTVRNAKTKNLLVVSILVVFTVSATVAGWFFLYNKKYVESDSFFKNKGTFTLNDYYSSTFIKSKNDNAYAYIASEKGMEYVVIHRNDSIIKSIKYDKIYQLQLSDDGNHFACVAEKRNGRKSEIKNWGGGYSYESTTYDSTTYVVVYDNKESQKMATMCSLILGSTGEHWIFTIFNESLPAKFRGYPYVSLFYDNKAVATFPSVYQIKTSQDLSHWMACAVTDTTPGSMRYSVMVDGELKNTFDALMCIAMSYNGKHYMYATLEGSVTNRHCVLFRDGKSIASYKLITDLKLSADGESWIYRANNEGTWSNMEFKGGRFFTVHKSTPSEVYDFVSTPLMTNDGRHTIYAVANNCTVGSKGYRGGDWFIVRDGKISEKFDVIFDIKLDSIAGNWYYSGAKNVQWDGDYFRGGIRQIVTMDSTYTYSDYLDTIIVNNDCTHWTAVTASGGASHGKYYSGGKWIVIHDGVESEKFDHISSLQITHDGEDWIFKAYYNGTWQDSNYVGGKTAIVYDGKRSPLFDNVEYVNFDDIANPSHWYCRASDGTYENGKYQAQRYYAICDMNVSSSYQLIPEISFKNGSLLYTAVQGGAKLANGQLKGGEYYYFYRDTLHGPYDKVWSYSWYPNYMLITAEKKSFSWDVKNQFFWGEKATPFKVIVNGTQMGIQYHSIDSITFYQDNVSFEYNLFRDDTFKKENLSYYPPEKKSNIMISNDNINETYITNKNGVSTLYIQSRQE